MPPETTEPAVPENAALGESVVETPEAAPAAPVEPAAAPAEETPGSSGGDAPTDWNGELESVQSSDWFAGLSDEAKAAVTRGLEAKYTNWNRGYSQKFASLAEERKALEARERAAKEQEARNLRVMYGTEDPLAAKDTEIEALRTQLEAKSTELQALEARIREENTEALKAAAKEGEAAVEAARQEAEAAKARIAEMEAAQAAEQEAALSAAEQELSTELQEKCPDILDNDAAFLALQTLLVGGIDTDDAVAMVRAKYPDPNTPEDADPAFGVMGRGRRAPKLEGPTVGSHDLMAAKRRENSWSIDR